MNLPRMRTRRMKPLIVRRRRTPQRLQRKRHRNLRRLKQLIEIVQLQTSDRQHSLRPIEQRNPFLRLKLQRLQPNTLQALNSRPPLTR
jgi:hypothetical protein